MATFYKGLSTKKIFFYQMAEIEPVLVENNNDNSYPGWNHEKDLAGIQTPMLVAKTVQEEVREGIVLRNSFVSHSQARHCGNPRKEHERCRDQSLQDFVRNFVALITCWSVVDWTDLADLDSAGLKIPAILAELRGWFCLVVASVVAGVQLLTLESGL